MGPSTNPGSSIAWANFLGREIAGDACPHLKGTAGKHPQGLVTEPQTRRIHGGYKYKN
jgi:hypothetical protein